MAYNADQIHRLAQDVGHTCGMDITCTKDCQVLSDQLRTFDSRYPVSVSTLRRFFGLVENQGKFSKTTLNTLARFCGHMSFEGWARQEKSSAPPVRPAPPPRATVHDPAQAKSDEAMKDEMRRFLKDHADPDHFRLNATQFNAFKDSWFELYRRGTFNMELWGEFKKLPHIHRFVVEQFTPLDFMSSFGHHMMEEYLAIAETKEQKLFGRGVIASGMVARGKPWAQIVPYISTIDDLSPSLHPLVQARQLGIALLMHSEMDTPQEEKERVRQLCLRGLRDDIEIWPQWSHQNCYFAFNLADWATLAKDLELVRACSENIERFRSTQDLYSRDERIDAVVDMRMLWNRMVLGDFASAKRYFHALKWSTFHTMETRALNIWYQAARAYFVPEESELAVAEFYHAGMLTGYKGFVKRISMDLMGPIYAGLA
ncbi:hypothetical protein OAW57_00100 [Flavobacteriales bacterium]|nr:hypothetical protein [Flavobacteriales bacterium]